MRDGGFWYFSDFVDDLFCCILDGLSNVIKIDNFVKVFYNFFCFLIDFLNKMSFQIFDFSVMLILEVDVFLFNETIFL